MSKRNGTSPIIAGLLIFPIIFLVKALNFDDSQGYPSSVEVNQTSNAYEALTYTEPKAPLNDKNLKAAFPPFSSISSSSLSAGELSASAPLSIPTQPEEQDYLGRFGCGENGSCYGDLNTEGVPKEVFVQGYYRADGTYVRSHYRSRPQKR